MIIIKYYVIKGYPQKEGIDYDKTFSHVAMLKSIWFLLAIVVHYDYEIWQIDVKRTFLNGELKEEDVYMTQQDSNLCLCLIIIKSVSYNNSFMDSNKFLEVGTFTLTKQLKSSILLDIRKKLVFRKKVSGSIIIFFGVICGWYITHWE